jgi:hypothetical protein
VRRQAFFGHESATRERLMTEHADRKSTDQQNKDAPLTNPEKSGVRTGNPQLDPDNARNTERKRGDRDIPRSPRGRQ